MMPSMADEPNPGRHYSGLCPDAQCQAKLVFRAYESSIECTECGQRHEIKMLRDVKEVTDIKDMLQNLLLHVLQAKTGQAKRGAEAVKVMGLSNYHCKILSPLLTRYGMDKKTGKARLLTQLNQGEIFECNVLGDRCFLIEPEHMELVGYGRDISGSDYLAETLGTVRVYNDNEERLLPLHADGDGHCLVHAVSRALVGRELFWHPLRTNLKIHMQIHLDKYKELFCEFIDQSEWKVIIDECSPEFEPPDGEILGLRNIHIFGLANVLRRPIILIDSLSGMQSPGDYSATFLPALVKRSECMGKSGELNKPLCIAWSSSGRNHYIPLVGIKNRPLPRLPRSLVPKAWGLPQEHLNVYIEFDQNDFCIIGGNKCLQDSYILRLAAAMEDVFMSEYAVHPSLVADVQHYIFKRTGVVGVKVSNVLEFTQKAVREQRLYMCLLCGAIFEQKFVPENFKPGGVLYALAVQRHGKLRADKTYPFPWQGVVCTYDDVNDELVPMGKETVIEKCSWCTDNRVRRVNGDGSVQYQNGDHTKTRAMGSNCKCGFKHFWNSQEYDNQPQIIPVVLEWGGKVTMEKVPWFQNETDPKLNSNVYTVATNLVLKHFPGVFGSERLVQKVVQQILEQTKKPEEIKAKPSPGDSRNDPTSNVVASPGKIILSGFGTIHKEELTLSETERLVRKKISENAPLQQNRRSSERGKSVESSKVSSGSRVTSSATSPSPMKDVSGSDTSSQTKSVSPAAVVKLERQSSARMIRVVTSDGRQLRMVLDEKMTRVTFLEKLEQELGLCSSRIRKILYGFPPRELVIPPLGVTPDSPLPFEAGDKVSVEIVAVKLEDDNDFDMSTAMPTQSTVIDGLQEESDVLRKIQDFQNSNVENLNLAITALMLTATLSNQDLWTYVQSQSHLFTAGGLFYRQVKRDVGLVDDKHFCVPSLPNKRLVYSQEHDRLELCVESYGHFAVVPGVEERAALGEQPSRRHHNHLGRRSPLGGAASAAHPEATSCDNETGSGGGVVISRGQQRLSSQVPFVGKGYSLSSSSPKESAATKRQHEVGRDDLISRLVPEGSQHEEAGGKSQRPEEQMETDDISGQLQIAEKNSRPAEIVRRGPGYSVINPEVANQANSQTDRLRNWVAQLGADIDFDNSQPEEDSPEPPFS